MSLSSSLESIQRPSTLAEKTSRTSALVSDASRCSSAGALRT